MILQRVFCCLLLVVVVAAAAGLCVCERERHGRTDGLEDLGFFANNKKARSGCAFLKLFFMANFLLHLPRGHQQ